MNNSYLILLTLSFLFCKKETCAQSVSTTLKLELESFLSIAVPPEISHQRKSFTDLSHIPIEAMSSKPFQIKIRSYDSFQYELPFRTHGAGVTATKRPPEVNGKPASTETVTKMGGKYSIHLFDKNKVSYLLVISITSL